MSKNQQSKEVTFDQQKANLIKTIESFDYKDLLKEKYEDPEDNKDKNDDSKNKKS